MIQTASEYKQYLKLNEIYDFLQVMIKYMKSDAKDYSYFLDLEAKRHLHILDEIDNADFERGDTDAPF
jgi:hypothetical protein